MNRVRRDERCLGDRTSRFTAHPPMGNVCIINLPLIAIVTDGVKFMLFNSPHNGSTDISNFIAAWLGVKVGI